MTQYMCIDLKSFYASVECVERGLDPMTANLVVADPDRSRGTICLAVSPALKRLGVKNRCRVYEIPKHIPYVMAEPRMQKYIDYAAAIYGIYLRYMSQDDIFVYSIDEAFLDVTPYLTGRYAKNGEGTGGGDAVRMAHFLMGRITDELGIRATCGIGTNLYLAKIALDITAKKSPTFIGSLDEESYRRTLWDHMPLTDFWRIGPGTVNRLARHGIYTMRQIALGSEELLYKLFGIDAELLIDHAWGREPTTMADIKAYRPKTNSMSSGQVLLRDYTAQEAALIVREMADRVCLDMTARGVVTDSCALMIGYSAKLPTPPTGGTVTFPTPTNSARTVVPALAALYEGTVLPGIPIRRINITCCRLIDVHGERQLSVFDDLCGGSRLPDAQRDSDEKLRALQETVLAIKQRYGKNALFRGMDLEEAATARQRNRQIGGHKA